MTHHILRVVVYIAVIATSAVPLPRPAQAAVAPAAAAVLEWAASYVAGKAVDRLWDQVSGVPSVGELQKRLETVERALIATNRRDYAQEFTQLRSSLTAAVRRDDYERVMNQTLSRLAEHERRIEALERQVDELRQRQQTIDQWRQSVDPWYRGQSLAQYVVAAPSASAAGISQSSAPLYGIQYPVLVTYGSGDSYLIPPTSAGVWIGQYQTTAQHQTYYNAMQSAYYVAVPTATEVYNYAPNISCLPQLCPIILR